MFALWVEGILAPTLRPGDVVILDNLPAHRSSTAADILREIGAWFLFLPKYSLDLNPIEMAFSKLKAMIRKVAARTYEDRNRPIWTAVHIWRKPWATRRDAELAIFQYINGFYNPRRRHSALGWKSPVAFERKVA